MADTKAPVASRKFGTFEGVFLPTCLSILGVIMYLRLGWVIGNTGIAGALLILFLAKSVTTATALSISSMATNIHVEGGGAYSIIAKSLGLEAGGSIGIPLYLAQSLSIVFYIIGFTTCFLTVFPQLNNPEINNGLNPQLISLAVWLILQLLCYHSTNLTIKLQYIILVFIVLSLISFFVGNGEPRIEQISFMVSGKENFWAVFAVFFPAVTGILAGIGMSGDLKDPRKSLVWGTLSAIVVSMLVYILVSFWLAHTASPDELRDISEESGILMVVKSKWKWMVISGVMGATLSSALGALLAAPRLAEALGKHGILPFSGFFAKRSKGGEPHNAVLFTGLIIGGGILLGNLDTIAQLLTVFFLLTYGILNLTVLIEDSIGVASFRPTFKVSRKIPLFGAISCGLIMLLINKVAFIIAILSTIVLYLYLLRKKLKAPFGDVRAGLFTSLTEYFGRIVAKLPSTTRSWMPKLLIPVHDPREAGSDLLLAKDIAAPGGSIAAFTVTDGDRGMLQEQMDALIESFKGDKVFTSSLVANAPTFEIGAIVVTQVIRSMAVRPNTLFFTVCNDKSRDEEHSRFFAVSKEEKLGLIMLLRHSRAGFGMQRSVRLWLHERSPHWNFEDSPMNWNLAFLVGIRLAQKWNCMIQVITVVKTDDDIAPAKEFLAEVAQRARLPFDTTLMVECGNFVDTAKSIPHADLNIFGIGHDANLDSFRNIVEMTGSSCLFVRDSGMESVIDT